MGELQQEIERTKNNYNEKIKKLEQKIEELKGERETCEAEVRQTRQEKLATEKELIQRITDEREDMRKETKKVSDLLTLVRERLDLCESKFRQKSQEVSTVADENYKLKSDLSDIQAENAQLK